MSSNRFGIRVEGLEEVSSALTDFTPREATNILRGLMYDIAATLRNEIRARAPRDTGDLRKSIAAKRSRMRRGVIGAEVYTKEKGWYWHFAEYGTTHHSERPYIRPAIQDLEAKLPMILDVKFARRLTKAAEKKANRS